MDIEEIFQKTKAILKGHFLLSSGLHSDTYFQMALLFQYPEYGKLVAEKLSEKFEGQDIDVVIGPAIGGIILSYQLGEVLGKRSVFTERKEGKMALRRGFHIENGEKVLVCEDVITTGGSVNEVIKIVEKADGEIVGVGCLVDRGEVNIDYPLKSLIKVKINNYPPSECPMCKNKIPLVKPGSK
jgi:orotate phosphoribosyltransferase